MNDKLVSVIMPIYGVENYLRKSIDSIIGQTYHNLQIILVDDGSNDSCPEICDEYALKDKRVTVIHKKNGGQAEARNFGLEVAKGDYIYFIDSDDFAEKNAIEYLMNIARNTNADVVIADIVVINENENVINYDSRQYMFDDLCSFSSREAAAAFADLDWGPWNKLYAREIFRNIRFPVGRIHEDEAIMFKIFNNIKKCVYTKKQLYNYIKRKGSTTTNLYSIKKMDWFLVWEDNYKYINKYFPEIKDKVLKKVVITAIYNFDNIIKTGLDNYVDERNRIIFFFATNKKEIIFSRMIRINYKIRCLLSLISIKAYVKLFINI